MMFIVRSDGTRPEAPGLAIKLARPTPAPNAGATTDFFCIGDAEALGSLRESGWQVIELRDGYYEDGKGGGVAIWGQGRYWEIRSEPLTVIEAVGPSDAASAGAAAGEQVEVRRAIFGA